MYMIQPPRAALKNLLSWVSLNCLLCTCFLHPLIHVYILCSAHRLRNQILCIWPVALSPWRGSRIRTAGNATGWPKLGIRAKHNTGLCIGIHRLKSKNLGHTECSWCALLLHSNFHCMCYENLSVCVNFQYVL